jgi:hypothetical protein
MDGMEDLDPKIKELVDQRVREALSGKRKRDNRSQVFFGIVVMIAGLIWLGKSLEIEWLDQIKFWPVVVILFGLYLIIGDRN